MKGGHAHQESALIAIALLVVIGIVDLFVNVADRHPAKIPGYFGLFFVIYMVARVFLGTKWK